MDCYGGLQGKVSASDRFFTVPVLKFSLDLKSSPVLKSFPGSGICEFYVEIRSDLRCPILGTHQANFVAVKRDRTHVLLQLHQQKDKTLRGADLQYAMPELLGDRVFVLAVLYVILF